MLKDAYARFRDEFADIAPDKYPASYIDGQVLSGEWRCWGTERAAIIAEIKTYPSGLKEVHGVAATGDLGEIRALIPLAEQWGRENGCQWAAIESRGGWERLLPEYQVEQVRIAREL
jgi:hypothetical protein